MTKLDLKVVHLALELIKERPSNSRTHSRKQLSKLAAAIRTFGFVVPVLVDNDNVLIAGHGRLQAARLEGLTQIPAICIRHLSPEQVRALTIADNRIAELAVWDKKLLAQELSALVELLPMPEIVSTGYELEEIQLMQDVAGSCSVAVKEEELPPVDRSTAAITRLSDAWMLGEDHRLLCADALLTDSYSQAAWTRPRRSSDHGSPMESEGEWGHLRQGSA